MYKQYFSNREFLKLLMASVAVVIIATGYKFLIKKDYDFVVEAPCNPALTTCFQRDCNEEECPPNGLENFRVFTLKAYDFPKCSDNSCLQECTSKTISCAETICGESEEDVCS